MIKLARGFTNPLGCQYCDIYKAALTELLRELLHRTPRRRLGLTIKHSFLRLLCGTFLKLLVNKFSYSILLSIREFVICITRFFIFTIVRILSQR